MTIEQLQQLQSSTKFILTTVAAFSIVSVSTFLTADLAAISRLSYENLIYYNAAKTQFCIIEFKNNEISYSQLGGATFIKI